MLYLCVIVFDDTCSPLSLCQLCHHVKICFLQHLILLEKSNSSSTPKCVSYLLSRAFLSNIFKLILPILVVLHIASFPIRIVLFCSLYRYITNSSSVTCDKSNHSQGTNHENAYPLWRLSARLKIHLSPLLYWLELHVSFSFFIFPFFSNHAL